MIAAWGPVQVALDKNVHSTASAVRDRMIVRLQCTILGIIQYLPIYDLQGKHNEAKYPFLSNVYYFFFMLAYVLKSNSVISAPVYIQKHIHRQNTVGYTCVYVYIVFGIECDGPWKLVTKVCVLDIGMKRRKNFFFVLWLFSFFSCFLTEVSFSDQTKEGAFYWLDRFSCIHVLFPTFWKKYSFWDHKYVCIHFYN